MSNKFKEYATSTAFNLSLSKNQVAWLLAFNENNFTSESVSAGTAATGSALLARGLLERVDRKIVVTEAGRKVCELLKIAGFSLRKQEAA